MSIEKKDNRLSSSADQQSIDRRAFFTKCSQCTAGLLFLAIPGGMATASTITGMIGSKDEIEDARKIFLKKGACSHALFYLLNREFGHQRPEEEKAVDPLAGGIMQMGFQCGVLWGATMAAGAETYRQSNSMDQAMARAITTSQEIVDAFVKKTNTLNCIEITNINWKGRFAMLKGMFNMGDCLRLVDKMSNKLLKVTRHSLANPPDHEPVEVLSCASETARQMGATDEQVVMVAGLAAGIGLSGHGCGALSAAIWMNTMEWNRQNPKKGALLNEYAKKTTKEFEAITGGEYECSKICGMRFNSVEEHTEYLKNGGCTTIINMLAATKVC